MAKRAKVGASKEWKIALVPVNVRVGDFSQNLKIHRTKIAEAAKQGASLVVFPELSLVGYPAQDLLHRPSWKKQAEEQLEQLHLWLQENFPELGVVVGTSLEVVSTAISPRNLANCAVFLEGKKREVRAKTLIPYYDVFHESRYFDSSETLPSTYTDPIIFQGTKIGLLICEDSWHRTKFLGQLAHRQNPTSILAEKSCEILINISASPFDWDKKKKRRLEISSAAKEHGLPLVYVNHFGAQDEILFDGDAFAVSPAGEYWVEKSDVNGDPVFFRMNAEAKPAKKIETLEMRDLSQMLVVGIRDYAKKNGFKRVVLGLSGGIDSAVVAVLAAEALGAENVIGLSMPSKYSSLHSVEDAESLAKNLGVIFRHVPIKMAHSTLSLALKPFFDGNNDGLSDENLQSRLRGLSVMAFANQFQALALTTGNKSELAMGYSTLYGDMCGALAPIGDLYKTQIYLLAKFLNEVRPRIPESTLIKPPSAELRPNQKDEDSLPPYDLLDCVLFFLVDCSLDPKMAFLEVKKRFSTVSISLIEQIHQTVTRNEFKRNQAPPILRVSEKAFGRGRMYPLTCLV